MAPGWPLRRTPVLRAERAAGAGSPSAGRPIPCGRFARRRLRRVPADRHHRAGRRRRRRAAAPVQPGRVLDRIKAPTLLIQGEADSLFPLAEADANARGIAATGTPVRVAWFTGGHDGGAGPTSDSDRVRVPDRRSGSTTTSRARGGAGRQLHLLPDRRLRRHGPGRWWPPASPRRRLPGSGRRPARRAGGAETVTGPAQPIANPPRRQPGGDLRPCPAPVRSARWSDQRPGRRRPRPARRLRVRAADRAGRRGRRADASGSGPPSPTGEAVLFVKLYDVDPAGGRDAARRPGRAGPADRTADDLDAGRAGDRSPCRRSCTGSRPGTGCGSWWPPPTRRTPRPPSRPSTPVGRRNGSGDPADGRR